MTPDRLLHDFEVAVEEKHGVKGIEALGQTREPAQVGEHDRDALFDAPAISILPHRGRGCSRLDEQADRQTVRGSGLAGEPDAGRSRDPLQRGGLRRVWRGQPVTAFHDEHTAGGASTTAAADRRMRDPGRTAHLKQCRARFAPQRSAAGINNDRSAPKPARQTPHQERTCDKSGHGPNRGFGAIDQVRSCGKKSSGERRRLEVHQSDPACALDPARQGQRGNQHSEDEEGRAPRLVPRLDP